MPRSLGLPSPRRFGRRTPFVLDTVMTQLPPLSPELRLFAGTYAAGFLLVSLFIA
jgi:hypothetical protein